MANARSRYADDALHVMGDTLRAARIEQRIAQHDLAERAGISRALLVRIERGDPGCAIGSVFEVAAVLRVPLFGLDDRDLGREATRLADRRALLPASVRRPRTAVDDDF